MSGDQDLSGRGEASRYSRQERLAELGPQGQRRLLASHVLVVGCGALGSNLANLLTRAGVGRLRIVDRDIIELSNLARQVLFDEQDVAAGLPKAEAAARKLRLVNSEIEIEALVQDVTAGSVELLLEGVTLVLDGTDNLETRYLLNDACVKAGLPWVYGGVIGTTGMMMPVLPGDGPCLRCLFPEPPPPGSLPTCETQGVLGTAPAIIAALQATEAIKLLIGAEPARQLLSINLWSQTFQQIKVLRDEACPACAEHRFDFLEARQTAWVTSLCGRNAIQITPVGAAPLSLSNLAERLARHGTVSNNGLLLKFSADEHELLIFPDGRVMIQGTVDETVAKRLYTRYIGG